MGEKAGAFTVDDHFAGKSPQVRKVYERLLDLLEKIGPVSEEPKKTSIHLVHPEDELSDREPPRRARGAALGEPVPLQSAPLGDRRGRRRGQAVAEGRVLAFGIAAAPIPAARPVAHAHWKL